jgi:hypothetical protein
VPLGAGGNLKAFAVGRPGCFRMIRDTAGRPTHCPARPVWGGTFRGGDGRRHGVRAYDRHRGGLEDAHRLKPEEGNVEDLANRLAELAIDHGASGRLARRPSSTAP